MDITIPSVVPFEFGNTTYLILDPGDKLDHVVHEAYVIESNADGTYHAIKKKALTDTGIATTTKDAAIRKCVELLMTDWAKA